jgi:hypothetical protein
VIINLYTVKGVDGTRVTFMWRWTCAAQDGKEASSMCGFGTLEECKLDAMKNSEADQMTVQFTFIQPAGRRHPH